MMIEVFEARKNHNNEMDEIDTFLLPDEIENTEEFYTWIIQLFDYSCYSSLSLP